MIREKNEKYHLVMMFAYLLGMVGNIKPEAIEEMLEDYKEELYQLRYNSKYTQARDKRVSKRVRQAEWDAKLLSEVAKMEYDENARL